MSVWMTADSAAAMISTAIESIQRMGFRVMIDGDGDLIVVEDTMDDGFYGTVEWEKK